MRKSLLLLTTATLLGSVISVLAQAPISVSTPIPHSSAPVTKVATPVTPASPTAKHIQITDTTGIAAPRIIPLPQPFAVDGQTPQVISRFNRFSESDELDRLAEQPPGIFIYNEADFVTVMRALADQSRMNFIAPSSQSKDSVVNNLKISSSISGVPPFEAMRFLSQSQGFDLVFDQGVWLLRPRNDDELIARAYQILHNPGEVYTDSGGSGGSSGGGGGMPSGLPDEGTSPKFKAEPPVLLENIKSILGITKPGQALIAPPTTTEASGAPAFDPYGNYLGTGEASPTVTVGGRPFGSNGTIAGTTTTSNSTGASGSQVVYNPDDSSFFVVATRQQHAFVLEYLRSADKPQADIALEARFFETSKNPKSELGVDWGGTLGGGYKISLTDISTNVDFSNLSSFMAPTSAILSAADLVVKLKALLTDRDTETVSYPRVVTSNNREVVIRSVMNLPILASNTTTQTTTTQSSQSVQYLPVGTVINVLPKLMPTGAIRLRVTITVSSVIGETQLLGQSYPVTSSRVYSGESIVNSGYTLAVGGLEETTLTKSNNKVPYVGDIPFFGALFRSQDSSRDRKNLMFFLTPTVLNSYSGGIREVRDTNMDSRADESRPDTTKPDWRNIIDYRSSSFIVAPLIDEGLLNVMYNRSPDRVARRSSLFDYFDWKSGSTVRNPKKYPFNEAQAAVTGPAIDPNLDISDNDEWSLDLINKYYNYYKGQASEFYEKTQAYQDGLNYLQAEDKKAKGENKEAIRERQIKLETDKNEESNKIETAIDKVAELLDAKIERFDEFVTFAEMIAGSRTASPPSNIHYYITKAELEELQSYGGSPKYRQGIMDMLVLHRKTLADDAKALQKAQRKAGLKDTTEGMQKTLTNYIKALDALASRW